MTRKQRRGLGILLLIWAGALLLLQGFYRPTRIDRSPGVGARAGEVLVGIDPNTASLEDLVAVPHLGERRARAIIATREKLMQASPGQPAFRVPADLEAVPGIGPVLRESMTPFFRFPGGSGEE